MTKLEGLRREGDLERVKAEAQARADAERQNEDIALRTIRVSRWPRATCQAYLSTEESVTS